jgi:CrcB protein
MRTVWIGLAGFFGAASRYQLEGWVSNRWPTAFPWGTFAVNVTGCFVLGFVFTLLTERLLPHPDLRTVIAIGFVGAYTTFSTFAFETLRLGEDGAVALALSNVFASVIAGIAAVWLGTVLGRAL